MIHREYAIQTKQGSLYIVDFQGLKVYYKETTPLAFEIAGKITGQKGFTSELCKREGIELDTLLHHRAFRGTLAKMLERYYIV